MNIICGRKFIHLACRFSMKMMMVDCEDGGEDIDEMMVGQDDDGEFTEKGLNFFYSFDNRIKKQQLKT